MFKRSCPGPLQAPGANLIRPFGPLSPLGKAFRGCRHVLAENRPPACFPGAADPQWGRHLGAADPSSLKPEHWTGFRVLQPPQREGFWVPEDTFSIGFLDETPNLCTTFLHFYLILAETERNGFCNESEAGRDRTGMKRAAGCVSAHSGFCS